MFALKKMMSCCTVFLVAASLSATRVLACTSIIISGKVTPDGKPLMMKHRDTGTLDNRMEWFEGEKYAFIGLVNSPSSGGEIWSGTNEAGFCIMNTATYDLKDDDVPASCMDQEGKLMYRALEICQDLKDFETFLDTLSRPMGVEANFGVLDAHGGAAYYETNNHSWTKFDVNEMSRGYRVVTNFTETGRPEDRKGVDRYEKAIRIMAAAPGWQPQAGWAEWVGPEGKEVLDVDAMWLMNHLSRSGKPIMRKITSATVVFSGVRSGENPLHTVMWTALGYPETTLSLPLMVLDRNHLPAYTRRTEDAENAFICDQSLKFKADSDSSLIFQKMVGMEETYVPIYHHLFRKWASGCIDLDNFGKKYDDLMEDILGLFQREVGKASK